MNKSPPRKKGKKSKTALYFVKFKRKFLIRKRPGVAGHRSSIFTDKVVYVRKSITDSILVTSFVSSSNFRIEDLIIFKMICFMSFISDSYNPQNFADAGI